MNVKFFVFSFLTFLLILSCKKEKGTIEVKSLPPNTEVGANTFIFRINKGEIINSEVGYIPIMPRISVYYNQNSNTAYNGERRFIITAGKEILGINRFVSIEVKHASTIGTYRLWFEHNFASFDINEKDQDFHYSTNSSDFGNIVFTKIDTINNIISARFDFYARKDIYKKQDVIEIDGQFDVKYKPNNFKSYY